MINFKKIYKNRFIHCFYLSIGCLPLSANSANLTQIKNHPIDEIVQQNTVKKSAISFSGQFAN